MCYFIVHRIKKNAGKNLSEYTDLFSLNDYKKNDKIIYQYFKDRCDRRSKSEV